MYQPQIDSWDGNHVEAYAAIAVKSAGSEEPTYGVAFIKARTEVDKGARLVVFDQLEIVNAKFPSAPDKEAAYREALQKDVAPKTRTMALDRFEAALAILEAGKEAKSLPLKNDPPRILFSATPAILVYVDGSAKYLPIKDTELQRVINTRPLVVKESSGKHYLHVFDGWMEAPSIEGPWSVVKKQPKDLDKALRAVVGGPVDLLEGGDPKDKSTKPSLKKGPVPAIEVATTPTELIVTEGEANYVPIEGTQLLYVKNTTGNVFKHIQDQKDVRSRLGAVVPRAVDERPLGARSGREASLGLRADS